MNRGVGWGDASPLHFNFYHLPYYSRYYFTNSITAPIRAIISKLTVFIHTLFSPLQLFSIFVPVLFTFILEFEVSYNQLFLWVETVQENIETVFRGFSDF